MIDLENISFSKEMLCSLETETLLEMMLGIAAATPSAMYTAGGTHDTDMFLRHELSAMYW
jgi:hypothetical protein